MKQFNRIEIHKDNTSLMRLIEKMKSLKNEDFFYDKEASDRTNEGCSRDTICKGTYYALFSTKQESLYYAIVYVSVKDDELLVFNINSSDTRFSELGITRYNFVINQFFHHFMAKCLDVTFTGCVTITGEELSLNKVLGDEVYKSLKRWEQLCNKENPITNPMDEKMWFDFVCKLHESGRTLHPTELSQWLSEDCQWPSYYNDVIADLSEKFEYSLSLLDYYGGFNNN